MGRRLISFFLLISAVPLFAEIKAERFYTLRDCTETALKNNHELLFAYNELKIAREKLSESRSIAYPQLHFDAYYAAHRLVFPSVLVFPGGGGFLFPDDRDNSYGAKLSLSQAIYSGGRVSAIKKQATAYYRQLEASSKNTENGVRNRIKEKFFTVLYYEKKLVLYEKYKSNHPLLAEKIKDAETERENALDDLKKDMGIELNVILEIDGVFEDIRETYDEKILLAQAHEYRPELAFDAVQEEINELSVRLAQSERKPNFKFISSFDYLADPESTEERWKRNWEVGVVLDIPLFDGFAALARWRQRKAHLDQARLSKSSRQDEIYYEIRKALREYERNLFRLQVLEEKKEETLEWEEEYLEVIYRHNLSREKILHLTGRYSAP